MDPRCGHQVPLLAFQCFLLHLLPGGFEPPMAARPAGFEPAASAWFRHESAISPSVWFGGGRARFRPPALPSPLQQVDHTVGQAFITQEDLPPWWPLKESNPRLQGVNLASSHWTKRPAPLVAGSGIEPPLQANETRQTPRPSHPLSILDFRLNAHH